MELAAYTTYGRRPTGDGLVAGLEVDSPAASADEFIAHMNDIMLSRSTAPCELLGIKIDADLRMHEGVSSPRNPSPDTGTRVPGNRRVMTVARAG